MWYVFIFIHMPGIQKNHGLVKTLKIFSINHWPILKIVLQHNYFWYNSLQQCFHHKNEGHLTLIKCTAVSTRDFSQLFSSHHLFILIWLIDQIILTQMALIFIHLFCNLFFWLKTIHKNISKAFILEQVSKKLEHCCSIILLMFILLIPKAIYSFECGFIFRFSIMTRFCSTREYFHNFRLLSRWNFMAKQIFIEEAFKI